MEKKTLNDQKNIDAIVSELYSSLVTLNITVKEMSKKSNLKVASKSMFTDILTQLLDRYDPGIHNGAPLSDDDTIRVLKMLGYPFTLREDVFKISGAAYNWQQLLGALNWLAGLIEAGVAKPALEESVNLLESPPESGKGQSEQEGTLFDVARDALERGLSVSQAANEYLSREEIPREEERLGKRVDALRKENQGLDKELLELGGLAASMTEARFLLNKTQEELKDKQREVSSLEKDVNIIKERTSEDKLREEAKVGVVHGLEDKLRELEEKCQKQELTVIDAGKLIAETKDLSNEARTVIQHISEAQNKIAELERLLTKESQAAQRLEKEWKERASSLENGNLMIDDQADYSKIYTGILGQAESRLGTLRAALEEVLSRESALKSAITQLQSDQNKLEQDRNNILQNISSSKGKLGELIQGRSAQEQALESKKIWANSEIIGVSQNLDTINSKNQVLEFELLTLNREVEQIKAIILQTAQQSSKLLITIKQDYLERIRTESQRISTIKQGVEQYLVQRKKST